MTLSEFLKSLNLENWMNLEIKGKNKGSKTFFLVERTSLLGLDNLEFKRVVLDSEIKVDKDRSDRVLTEVKGENWLDARLKIHDMLFEHKQGYGYIL